MRHLVFVLAFLLGSLNGASAQFWGASTPAGIPFALDNQPVPAIAAGVCRLFSSYTTNKVFDLTRASDSTTQTIGFVNNCADWASAASFCASTTCTNSKWYNQSPAQNGCDLVQATVANAMAYTTNTVAGIGSVTWNSNPHAITNLPTTQIYSTASCVSWSPSNSVLAIVGQHQNSEETRIIFQDAGNSRGVLSNFNSGSSAPSLIEQGGNVSACGLPVPASPSVVLYSWQNKSVICLVNNLSTTTTATATVVSEAGLDVGGTVSFGTFDALAVAIWVNGLNPTQMASVQSTLASHFNISLAAPANTVVESGDSMSSGEGSTLAGSWLRQTLPLLSKGSVTAFNDAIYGQTACQIATRVSVYFPAYYQTSGRFVAANLSGANDIRASTPVATIEGCLQSWVSYVKAQGSNAYALIATTPVQCDIFNNGTELAALQSLNAWIIANWNVPQASGGLGADGLINFWADPTIGPGNYSSSAFCGFPNNISWDGLHPKDNAMGFYAPIAAAAINPLLQ